MESEIRRFRAEDLKRIIDLLRLNTPEYFSPDEEGALVYYLQHEIEHYFVFEVEGEVVGCGGFNFSGDPSVGKISWDIFHPDFQGKSLGSKLLHYRIEELKAFPKVKRILVRTSQQAYRFYEKNGFELISIEKNYWAEGFDLYEMEFIRLRKPAEFG